jgi:hypothetical protein
MKENPMKTVRICFKGRDSRAGQMVELDEAGARREIENGAADPVSDEEWDAYQKAAQPRKSDMVSAPAAAPAPAKKAANRSR